MNGQLSASSVLSHQTTVLSVSAWWCPKFRNMLEPVRLERFRSVPPYKVPVSDRFKTEGQPFLYAKLSQNGTVDPPSVPAEQALNSVLLLFWQYSEIWCFSPEKVLLAF